MRYLQMLIGLVVLVRGGVACTALPARLSALRFDSAYAMGQAAGLVVVSLALLAGGVLLIAQSGSRRRAAPAGRASP